MKLSPGKKSKLKYPSREAYFKFHAKILAATLSAGLTLIPHTLTASGGEKQVKMTPKRPHKTPGIRIARPRHKLQRDFNQQKLDLKLELKDFNTKHPKISFQITNNYPGMVKFWNLKGNQGSGMIKLTAIIDHKEHLITRKPVDLHQHLQALSPSGSVIYEFTFTDQYWKNLPEDLSKIESIQATLESPKGKRGWIWHGKAVSNKVVIPAKKSIKKTGIMPGLK